METESVNRFAPLAAHELHVLQFALDTLEMVIVNGRVLGLGMEAPVLWMLRTTLLAEIQQELKRRERETP